MTVTDRKLKVGWKVWRFDQMAINVNDRIDDPSKAGVDRYVGLEHLESESLRIRRWGSPTDVEATKLFFRKGDIIFGRRRAYQRKLAVADFDGICSAHAMVLRARPEVVLPEFLPFFMQSDPFMNRAQQISVGSLSPTINWKTLAAQEFALPPLEEQQLIVVRLTATRNAREAFRDLAPVCRTLEAAFLNRFIGGYISTEPQWPTAELRQIAFIQSGVAKGRQAIADTTIDVPYLAVSNVQDGYLNLDSVGAMPVEKSRLAQYLLKAGDVLLTEGGDPDKLGRGTVWQEEIAGCVHQNHVFAIRPDKTKLDPWFLSAVTASSYGKQYFLSCAKRTSNLATINKQQVGSMLVPIPPLTVQRQITSDWMSIRATAATVNQRWAAATWLEADGPISRSRI